MATRTISNTEDIIDSRDVIARIEELESDRESITDTIGEMKTAVSDAEKDRVGYKDADDLETLTAALDEAKDDLTKAEADLADFDQSDDGQELTTLKALAEEADGYAPDWQYGEALIRDSYFVTYAQEMADELGYDKRSNEWPYTCIDWERAAEELKMDYTSVDFDGIDYWIRS